MRPRSTASSKARPDTSHRRVVIVASVLVFWMFAITARIVYLQTFQHEWLQKRARMQQQDMIETSPLRGLVLDREGRELARSVDTESFFVVPGEITDPKRTSAQLAPLVGVDARALEERLLQAKEGNRKFAWIARKLDHEQAERINALKLEGVYSLKEPKRSYPNGSLAAHVLGFVGLDEVGLAGIEQFYDERVRGLAGKVFIETDAHRRPYSSFEQI